ncbi:phenylalanine--tRNA ligase subunit beta [Candidatus Halobeggiatoa sp. HSG11]|nr:phenylalanine--tRNA ligase subunit beta [Candidatus Halobeggiatoa sp. HSG11]
MKFSENWLREWVNPSISTDELMARLTMAGLEFDNMEPVAATFNKVVIGEVVSVEPHPNAKKLSICKVNVGENEPMLNIVCGASNVCIGMKVPTALIEAKIEDLKIEKSELRGVISYGMLCSAKELGLEETSNGIMALPKDAPTGIDLRQYMQLEDSSIEIDLTPNRGDCLSIEGIAREVGALTKSKLTFLDCSPVNPKIEDTLSIDNHELCPHYVGRIIKNINIKATTPIWLQERLRRSGIRCISPVVDVTNYILLELGQPMHAFDLDCLTGDIKVRMAQAGETLTLLDEQSIDLDEQSLIIADHNKPLALAGIMGGKDSGVTDKTNNIFLESAFFAPTSIASTARRYKLHTDSSHRFERGVDPQLQRRAIERATALLINIVGGQPGPITETIDDTVVPAPIIKLRSSKIKQVLGTKIKSTEIPRILISLGMTVTPYSPILSDTSFKLPLSTEKIEELVWGVCPPSYRFDINLEIDLIEELARIYGYDNIPSQAPKSDLNLASQPTLTLEQLQTILVQRDYQEAITYSFVDPELQTKLDPEAKLIELANPLAKDMAVMRTTLWAGLLPIIQYNQKRQIDRVRLFETGLRFIQSKELQQEQMLAGAVSGVRWSEQWGQTGQQIDFFDVKSDVENLIGHTNYRFAPTTHPALHPGQTAAIFCDDEQIGLLGALHPSLIQDLELQAPVYLFELRLLPLHKVPLPQFKEISKYPSIRRDLALLVSEDISISQLQACIWQMNIKTLIDLQLFDVYQGKGIAPDQKSLAIGLLFQSESRSLTDSEIDDVVKQVVHELEQTLGAKLRN